MSVVIRMSPYTALRVKMEKVRQEVGIVHSSWLAFFDLLLLDWLLFLTAENGSASYDVSSVHCYK